MAIKKSENLEVPVKKPIARKKIPSANVVKKPVSAHLEALIPAVDVPVPSPAGDVSAVSVPPVIRSREFAITVLGLGLAFGLLHSYFFFDQKLGISYPIFMALACSVLWYLGKTQGKAMEKKEFLWLVPILYFSLMVAVRSAELLTLLNIVVSFF